MGKLNLLQIIQTNNISWFNKILCINTFSASGWGEVEKSTQKGLILKERAKFRD